MAFLQNRLLVSRAGRSVTRRSGASWFGPILVGPALIGAILVGGVVFGAAGCASTAGPAEISVEGTVTTRGNEPFTAYVLETEDQNAYVLVFEEAMPEALRTPVRMRVEGLAYSDSWEGQPYAHLRVRAYEPQP
jgi:hypothetical protein